MLSASDRRVERPRQLEAAGQAEVRALMRGQPVEPWPSKRTVPVSLRSVPQMQLTSVILPEPFGPIRPTRSPGCDRRSMSSSATKPPKRLPRPLTSSSGRSRHRRLPRRARRRALHQPDDAVGRDDDEGDQQQPTISRLTRRRDRHRRDLLQRAEQDRADQRTDPAGRAADQRHRDGVDRVGEAEAGGRVEIGRCNRATARRPCPSARRTASWRSA